MNSSDLNTLIQHFETKISTIWDLVAFVQFYQIKARINGRRNYTFAKCRINRQIADSSSDGLGDEEQQRLPDLDAMTDMIYEMKDMLRDIRKNLLQQKVDIEIQKKRVIERNTHLKQHIAYLKGNIPSFLTKNEKSEEIHSVVPMKPKAETGVQKAKPVVRKVQQQKKTTLKTSTSKTTIGETNASKVAESKAGKRCGNEEMYKNWPLVSFITVDEFESIPQYMRGRVTYEMINRAVTDFNNTITRKYQLMSTHSSKYTEDEFKKYQFFKSQENADTVGHFFCLMQDFKELSAVKAENSMKIILTCLRHCKRIKEIRGPIKLIRYAIVRNGVE